MTDKQVQQERGVLKYWGCGVVSQIIETISLVSDNTLFEQKNLEKVVLDRFIVSMHFLLVTSVPYQQVFIP